MTSPSAEPKNPARPASRYITVMLIPVVGANGKVQNRTLTFDRPPTKEFAVNTCRRLHTENVTREGYDSEWERCAVVLSQISEERFSRMNQRRATSMTQLVDVTLPNGSITQRMFSARSCMVHEVIH